MLTEVLRRGRELQLAGCRRRGANKQGKLCAMLEGITGFEKRIPKRKGMRR